MKRHIFFILCFALLAGCVTRKPTLTDIRTGELCHGEFNLMSRNGWVVLPDGTKLTGKIFGVTNARYASSDFEGSGTVYGPGGSAFGSFSGTGSSFSPGNRGEGWALLRSEDGKKIMEIHVVSNGAVTAGYGEARMNDGRVFRLIW